MKRYRLKKQVKIMIVAVALILLLLIAGFLFYSYQKQPKVKTDHFVFEYGDKVEIDRKEILETDDEDIIASINLDESSLKTKVEDAYPEVGTYQVPVSFQTRWKTCDTFITIEIRDTSAPKIEVLQDTVEVEIDETDRAFEKCFKVSDLSEYTLEINTEEVDFSKAGEYRAKAIASDIYGNTSEEAFTILVKEIMTTANTNTETTANTNTELTYVNGILIVNKKHPLPADYAPGEDATAGTMIRSLINDMQLLGYDISDYYSGYRSYSYQDNLYWNYVSQYGQAAADTFSARAGYSEHQSGLAFDLLHGDGTLVTQNAEAKWIAENAYHYGFIVRYPEGKESITGYQPEPWHLRYVGEEAEAIYHSGLTLEEYLGVEGGSYE